MRSTLQELKIRLLIDNCFELNQHFIEIFKKKIMKEFNLKDKKLINSCYAIFLNPINDLFKEIETRIYQKRLFASSLKDLISKCNLTIFDNFLSKQSNEHYLNEYLINVHERLDHLSF